MTILARMLFLILLLPTTALAVQPDEILADSALEARARAISQDLRCLVCQNQSIDDSEADLAHDLRVLVRQRLQAGDTDAEVKQYIVERYGNYVLLSPPFNPSTGALWLGPLAMLLAGITVAILFYRQRQNADPESPLSPDEEKRVASLIDLPGNDT
jgi:cytochrome c-type biogenesis protein CcmH